MDQTKPNYYLDYIIIVKTQKFLFFLIRLNLIRITDSKTPKNLKHKNQMIIKNMVKPLKIHNNVNLQGIKK